MYLYIVYLLHVCVYDVLSSYLSMYFICTFLQEPMICGHLFINCYCVVNWQEVNGCNCTRSTTKKFTAVATFFFFLFFVIAIVTRDSLLVAFYAVALIVACTGCNLLCLPCCQPTKGADE